MSIRFWFYSVRAIWRTLHGRWYVWRDAPTSVVREAAILWREVRNDKNAEDDVKAIILSARNEYLLRKRRGEA